MDISTKLNFIIRNMIVWHCGGKGTVDVAEVLTSGGCGYSKGFDLFFNDRVLLKNLGHNFPIHIIVTAKRKFQNIRN